MIGGGGGDRVSSSYPAQEGVGDLGLGLRGLQVGPLQLLLLHQMGLGFGVQICTNISELRSYGTLPASFLAKYPPEGPIARPAFYGCSSPTRPTVPPPPRYNYSSG